MSRITYKNFSTQDIETYARSKGCSFTSKKKSSGGSSIYDNTYSQTNKIDLMQMEVDGLACEYYLAEYKTFVNDVVFTQEMYAVVFRIKLDYKVEDLFIESRTKPSAANVLGWPSIAFVDSKLVDLEGDFSSFFRVHTPQDEQINAFTILAPNLMMQLLESGANYNFEFSSNYIYIHQSFDTVFLEKVKFTQSEFEAFVDFGVNAAHSLARAARPTKIKTNTSKHMWQLRGSSKPKFLFQLIITLPMFFLLFFALISPLSWPLLFVLFSIYLFKKARFMRKRIRMLKKWN